MFSCKIGRQIKSLLILPNERAIYILLLFVVLQFLLKRSIGRKIGRITLSINNMK